MPRIVLKYPFLRHYAGSVFDLEPDYSRPADEVDERYDDRLPPKKRYLLPDGGKGYAASFPVHDTVLCPPDVFDTIDLRTGPCRLTSMTVESDSRTVPDLTIGQVVLSEDKQRISIPFSPVLHRPMVQVWNRTDNALVEEQAVGAGMVDLFFGDYLPGFYELHVVSAQQVVYRITFIKCFPLVVTVNPILGTYEVMKTIY